MHLEEKTENNLQKISVMKKSENFVQDFLLSQEIPLSHGKYIKDDKESSNNVEQSNELAGAKIQRDWLWITVEGFYYMWFVL